MTGNQIQTAGERNIWVEPEIRELDVRETSASPGRGADVGGNPGIDSQLS